MRYCHTQAKTWVSESQQSVVTLPCMSHRQRHWPLNTPVNSHGGHHCAVVSQRCRHWWRWPHCTWCLLMAWTGGKAQKEKGMKTDTCMSYFYSQKNRNTLVSFVHAKSKVLIIMFMQNTSTWSSLIIKKRKKINKNNIVTKNIVIMANKSNMHLQCQHTHTHITTHNTHTTHTHTHTHTHVKTQNTPTHPHTLTHHNANTHTNAMQTHTHTMCCAQVAWASGMTVFTFIRWLMSGMSVRWGGNPSGTPPPVTSCTTVDGTCNQTTPSLFFPFCIEGQE